MKPQLIRHLEGESIGHFPVWMMRQAGRYLESYRALRKEHSFWEMVTTPELASKVSLLPIEKLPVDAVIFFSDILTLPYGFGLQIEMQEAIGPVVVRPFQKYSDFEALAAFSPEKHTAFVGEALSQIKKQLPEQMALIGFAGAPWTVATYLIEGSGKTHFQKTKQWLYREPLELAQCLEKLADATIAYLKYQVKSGVHLVQLFDTWVSEMPHAFFKNHYRTLLNRIFDEVKKERVPVIYFCKRAAHLIPQLRELHADILSVDELYSLTEWQTQLGNGFHLQGNLDPSILLGKEVLVRKATRELVSEANNLIKPPILNLAHGIYPETPFENAAAFIQEARTKWI